MYVMYVFLFLIINKYNIRHSNTAIAHTAIYPIYFFTDNLRKIHALHALDMLNPYSHKE